MINVFNFQITGGYNWSFNFKAIKLGKENIRGQLVVKGKGTNL